MPASIDAATLFPNPFEARAWPKKYQDAVRALWRWHLSLTDPPGALAGREDTAAFWEEEAGLAEAGSPLRVVPGDVSEAAYEACRAHRLPRDLLAAQVRAAARYTSPLRFETYPELQAFVAQWAGSHAQLLARLAGQKGTWQVRPVHELAQAFFLTGRLARLARDLARDRVFIPLDEIRQAGVGVPQLRTGPVDEAMKRLFWKQSVRIRDAFAQGQALVNDLSGWQARQVKRWWLGGLEVLNEIERRNYDVWTRPVRLSAVQRTRVRMQAFVGKTSFR